MTKIGTSLALVTLVTLSLPRIVFGQQPPGSKSAAYAPVTKYDPARDGVDDVSAAVDEARRSGKRVLVEIGGDWCEWCHFLQAFFDENPALQGIVDQNYVSVKVFSDRNGKATLYYPKPTSYPYLVVLDSDGVLLCAQDTGIFECEMSYDPETLARFLVAWAPKR